MMASKPLTLKYRPKRFDSFVGNEINAKIIKKSISKGIIHNLLLFTGMRGTGKTSLARVTAKALNCPSEGAEPCNDCLVCNDIDNERHRDVVEMDAGSNSSVSDTRELAESVQYQPAEADYKVYIIDEVHGLSKQAWKPLLKPTEEGNDNVVFIFCTTKPNKVPEAIKSRAQEYKFSKITSKDIYKRINYINNKEELGVKDENLKKIAIQSDEMREGITLLEHIYISKEDKKIVKTLLNDISDKKIKKIIKLIINDKIKETMSVIKNLRIPIENVAEKIIDYIIRNLENAKFMKVVGEERIHDLIKLFSDVLEGNYKDKNLMTEVKLLSFRKKYNEKW